MTWGEHGPLTLTVLSRDQTDLALLKVDPTWGETNILLTEHADAWVNLPQDVPVWLSEEDGSGFLWASESTERSRTLERRRDDGALEYIYTHTGIIHFNPAGENLRVLAGVTNGQSFEIYSGSHPARSWVSSSPMNKFVTSYFIHQPVPHEDEGQVQLNVIDGSPTYVEQTQSLSTMPTVYVRRVGDPEFLGVLPSQAVEPPFVPIAELKEPEGGQGCASVVVRPRGFDAASGRKYPVIVDVYGGPGHQQVVASMRSYLLDQWLADQGFIVVAIDGRGTPGRGRDWERAIAGHFGSVPLDDQVEALKLLGARHPEMDLDRVGITGWSFGGYMSALAVLRRPDVFKAAVAGAPVSEWMDYDTCYTERYLGVPGASRWPDAYREGSLLTYAAGLSRPLLVIHGTADDNVYLRHSLELMNAFFRAGRTAEFLPLSSFTHMVPDPVVRTRLEERVVDYFHAHLGPP